MARARTTKASRAARMPPSSHDRAGGSLVGAGPRAAVAALGHGRRAPALDARLGPLGHRRRIRDRVHRALVALEVGDLAVEVVHVLLVVAGADDCREALAQPDGER